jgi:hypothetical protein
MRKILLSLSVLGSIAAVGGAASAAPAPIVDNPAHVQTVQYYAPHWRGHENWRHRRHNEWRRREAWHHHHGWRERHGWYGRPHFYAGPGW